MLVVLLATVTLLSGLGGSVFAATMQRLPIQITPIPIFGPIYTSVTQNMLTNKHVRVNDGTCSNVGTGSECTMTWAKDYWYSQGGPFVYCYGYNGVSTQNLDARVDEIFYTPFYQQNKAVCKNTTGTTQTIYMKVVEVL